MFKAKLKGFAAIIMAMSMMLSFTGCGNSSGEGSTAVAKAMAPAATVSESSAPEAETNLDVEAKPVEVPTVSVPTDAHYNAMSADELYAQAKKEDGKIIVYSTSSKVAKVAKAFMEVYPDLEVEVTDLDGGESITKVVTEVDSGNLMCDVIQDSDARGDIAFNYYGKYLEAYYPDDICANIDENLMTYGMPLYSSISYWFYNTDTYPDGAPINNWWDIVECNADGTQKYDLYGKEIGSEATYLALYSHFVANPEGLEEAYKAKYGKAIDYTYDADALGVEPNNAGYELLYRLSQLKITFISDGDEIVQAVDNSTAEKPAIGLSSAGKIGNRDENGYAIAWVTDLAPFVSLQNTSYAYTTTGSDHPAGARLFIWYMCGGENGDNDGYAKLMKEGSWSTRNDFVNDKNPFTLADSNTVPSDLAGIYEHYLDVSDFWAYWHNLSPNK
ncbi:extracellular solute-binding protein [Fusibacter paucivorans]|uniref:Extracellular solute-binding protein n=1 Tax=Fusibacter paucivorans TaxID=76009 RepID=A0ABS5PJI6_9FIRM|nr:extracellular solute-binding protein [Fusibacter paucivorans]MBS7525294.1 extracellular solute-binding protein [Fusibacter paucivorans]